jgi:hypothetical protein
LGTQSFGSGEEEQDIPVRKAQGTGAAARLKKANAVKNAKKGTAVKNKGKPKAKKPIALPTTSDDDEGMPDADPDLAIDTDNPITPAPIDNSISFDFKHLARYLTKAKNPTFTGRSTDEQAKITQKIGRDLECINYWVEKRHEKGLTNRERSSAAKSKARGQRGVGGPKKAMKGKNRAKAVDFDEEMEEDEVTTDDNENDISDGTYRSSSCIPFHATEAG